MFVLRPFQTDLKNGLYSSWQAGNRNVMLQLPTGGGKTVVMASISSDLTGISCAIAHRKELVGQISSALAKMGVDHNIIGSDQTISFCINKHIAEHGRSFYNARASFTVASVDTLSARRDSLMQWASTVDYWMIDEGHHVLPSNKWGKVIAMFRNARGIGYTASPIRADRKSLSANQGGIFHDMVSGPNMRWLIDNGYLADYRIFGPPQSIDVSKLKISKGTGDYERKGLVAAAEKSTITGDIVSHYLRIAEGKRGITFTVDVKHAMLTAEAFRKAGVPAEAISGNTPDGTRDALIQKFVDGRILQLVNVDLFGEGFDVPAVEVVSMGRPTQSFGLYLQQFGRTLRTAEGKTHGTVIDHVSNVKSHGLPDAVRAWSLEVEKGQRRVTKDPDVMPVTTCIECFRAYEAIHPVCPFCGTKPEPASRSEPQFVDGDLAEYSPELLAQMRGEIDYIDGDPVVPFGASRAVRAGVEANWRKRQGAQAELRDTIAQWAGVRKHIHGDIDPMIHRRFYHRFGVDVYGAMALGTADARDLTLKIKETL